MCVYMYKKIMCSIATLSYPPDPSGNQTWLAWKSHFDTFLTMNR